MSLSRVRSSYIEKKKDEFEGVFRGECVSMRELNWGIFL